jgi:HEAT repeat protein
MLKSRVALILLASFVGVMGCQPSNDSSDFQEDSIEDFSISKLVNPEDPQSRVGLAKALQHIEREQPNRVLLQLAADEDEDVRRAALSSIQSRPFHLGNFDISGLIEKDNWSSRVGLAQALQHVHGDQANQVLLQLAADEDADVRRAALNSIEAKKNRNPARAHLEQHEPCGI